MHITQIEETTCGHSRCQRDDVAMQELFPAHLHAAHVAVCVIFSTQIDLWLVHRLACVTTVAVSAAAAATAAEGARVPGPGTKYPKKTTKIIISGR